MRDEAVNTIHRAWKRFRMITMIPKVMKERRKRALIIIQKFMKGYYQFYKYKDEIRQFKLQNNFEYFNSIRLKLQTESQLIIRRFWLRK